MDLRLPEAGAILSAMEPEPARNTRSAWRRAEEYGFDMSLVEENLRLTPAQRLRAHSSALALADRLREAKRTQDARS